MTQKFQLCLKSNKNKNIKSQFLKKKSCIFFHSSFLLVKRANKQQNKITITLKTQTLGNAFHPLTQ